MVIPSGAMLSQLGGCVTRSSEAIEQEPGAGQGRAILNLLLVQLFGTWVTIGGCKIELCPDTEHFANLQP